MKTAQQVAEDDDKFPECLIYVDDNIIIPANLFQRLEKLGDKSRERHQHCYAHGKRTTFHASLLATNVEK